MATVTIAKRRNPTIPWRFLVPHSNYFWYLKVAKSSPEVRGIIDRESLLIACEKLLMAVYLLVYLLMAPLMLVGLLALVLVQIMPSFPDFASARKANFSEADRIIAPAEIRRRMGL